MDVDLPVVLWENIRSLMLARWGEENTNRLVRTASLGQGTGTRIKNLQEGTGINTLRAIAGCFGVDAWQLLVPGFDPKHPPMLQAPRTPEALSAAKMLDSIPDDEMRRKAYALIVQTVQFGNYAAAAGQPAPSPAPIESPPRGL